MTKLGLSQVCKATNQCKSSTNILWYLVSTDGLLAAYSYVVPLAVNLGWPVTYVNQLNMAEMMLCQFQEYALRRPGSSCFTLWATQ